MPTARSFSVSEPVLFEETVGGRIAIFSDTRPGLDRAEALWRLGESFTRRHFTSPNLGDRHGVARFYPGTYFWMSAPFKLKSPPPGGLGVVAVENMLMILSAMRWGMVIDAYGKRSVAMIGNPRRNFDRGTSITLDVYLLEEPQQLFEGIAPDAEDVN